MRERLGDRVFHSVEPLGQSRLGGEVDQLGRPGLHPEGQFVRGDAGVELAGLRARHDVSD